MKKRRDAKGRFLPEDQYHGPEPWTGPDGNDYLINPDGSYERLKGRW